MGDATFHRAASRRAWLRVRAIALPVIALSLMPVICAEAASRKRLTHGDVAYELTSPAGRSAQEGPLVVLVAGFAVPMVVWDATVPALVNAGFTVLRFDLYGRGGTARPRLEYRPELFAEQIWELLRALDLPQRFDIVASSMGGAVAAVFAARHPDALNRVVLVGPAGLSHDFPFEVTILRSPGIGKWYFTSRFREVMLDHLRDNVSADPCVYPHVLAAYYRQLEIPGTADAMYSTFRHTLLGDVREDYRWLGRRHRPTLAIWGADDRIVPRDDVADELRRLVPHLSIRTVRGSGHLPQLERPRAFNTLVTTFLLAP
jgi:pimeloyl-ACP methyl ester carboxylesterase